jgi:hypothetical protein
MIPVPLEIDEIAASCDPRDGGFEITAWGDVYRMREWTWGERLRLVELCSRGGALDAPAFVNGLVTMLFEPVPPSDLQPLFGHVALSLMGVRSGQQPMPLRRAELRLAQAFGWTPGAIGAEPASGLDRLLCELDLGPRDREKAVHGAPRQERGPVAGWKRIQVDDG